MASYIHPSVTSRIIDNSVVFLSSTGLTNLFSVFVSEKGPDRELKYITSEEEFKFYYGEPNVRKYGQAAYNIINWLRANGGVWCLRVTADGSIVDDIPTDPATYANTSFVVRTNRNNITFPVPTYTAGTRQETRLTVTAPASGVIAAAPVDIPQIWKISVSSITGTPTTGIIDLVPFVDSTGTASFGAVSTSVPAGASASTIVSSLVNMFNAMADGGAVNYYSAVVDNTNPSSLIVTYLTPGAIVGSPQFNPQVLVSNSVVNLLAGEVTSLRTISQTGGQRYPTRVRISNTSSSFLLEVELVNGLSTTQVTERLVNAINAAPSLPFTVKNAYKTGDKTLDLVYTATGIPDSLTFSDPDSSGAQVRFSVQVTGEDKEWVDGTRRYAWVRDADTNGARYVLEDGTLGTTYTLPTQGEAVVLSSFSTPLADVLLEKGKNFASVKGNLATLTPVNVTAGVNYDHYLFAVLPKGRGGFYNGLGYRLTPNFDLVGTYPDFVLYNFDVVELYRGSEITRESFLVALSPDAVSTSRESLHIADVVNRYSNYLEVVFNEDAYELLGDQLSGSTSLNPDLVDVVSWRPLSEVKVQYVSAGSGKTVTITLDAMEQNGVYTHRTDFTTSTVYLLNGSDGTIASTRSTDRSMVAGLTNKILAAGYSGATVPTVLDKRSVDIDVLLDANYDLVVKNAISNFAAVSRMDCMAFLDTGFTASAAEALDVRTSLPTTRYTSIFTQDFIITDEFTGRDDKFTATYFLATKIANNDELNGISMNFVGPRRGGISGFKTMSWNPTPVQKDSLYKAQVNYCETDPSGTIFATQLTSQRQNSAMSNISMVRTIMRMQREAELIAASYRHEYGNAETFKQLQVNLGNALYKYVRNGALKSLNVKVYASDYDLSQKLARVSISVQFTDIIERFEIDFVVNR